jgi:adenylylsulfate kinase
VAPFRQSTMSLNVTASTSCVANDNTVTTASDKNNIVWHEQKVTRDARWKIGNHGGALLWFTGLSAAGKSSIANQLEMLLNEKGYRTYLLDGDNIRHGLCQDLGFSVQDRVENIRRVGQLGKLLADSGCVVLAALISPYRNDRDSIRQMVQNEGDLPFVEIYVNASLAVCEQRDPKGLYLLARNGKIKNFTGIDDPYEEPLHPEISLHADHKLIHDLAEEVLSWLDLNKTLQLSKEAEG